MEFTRTTAAVISALFEPVEIGLLRLATSQLAELVEAGQAQAPGTAADPALRRLLPDAYPDDPRAAAEFRRFTADSLLERKLGNARAVLASLGTEPPPDPDEIARDRPPGAARYDPLPVAIVLDEAMVQSWLRTLTDLRLTIAERLEITPDGVQHLDSAEAPFLRDVYNWFGMVQESLVYAVDP